MNNIIDTKKKIKNLSRHPKLSLKKNKLNTDVKPKKNNRSSDVIILDESFDRFRQDTPKHFKTKPIVFSPIVLDDSCYLTDDDLPTVTLRNKRPSKTGNVSFNCSRDTPSPVNQSQPSLTGWSPAQHIITAKPKNDAVPSTPRDKHNKSQEQCTMKTIEHSQKKILNELYGASWKSIPKLFKTISREIDNFEGVTKKLFDDDDEDKENCKHLKLNKESYLPSSNVKRIEENLTGTEKKSKKKLFKEVATTPDITKQKTIRNVNSTTKKVKIKKGMSVTEMVEVMKNDDKAENDNVLINRIENNLFTNREKIHGQNIVNGDTVRDFGILTMKGGADENDNGNKILDALTKKIENVAVTPKNDVKRLSFMGSLADNVPTWRCHPEAFQYIDNFKSLKEQLTRRLFKEFNSAIFGDGMDADMKILWDSKLRSTAGTTTNSLVKTARGDRIHSSVIKLSTKVVDTPARLRDTLVHEMCHAATWIIDREMRAGHGPLWKKWARRALQVFPELGEISRCHDLEIHFKYSYKCIKCGYTIQRHSKSIDITKKGCGYCYGTFQLVINKKNKDGVVVTTPARKANNGFAVFVKENYASVKDGSKTHAEVMKMLGEQYSAKKTQEK